MTLFDRYHELAAQLMGRDDFPLPMPNWDRNYPHNVCLLSDAEESELAAVVLQLTRGMSYESWMTLDLEQRVPWMEQAVKKRATGGAPSRSRKIDVLTELSNRVKTGMLIVTADELARWPEGIADELIATGMLNPTDNATSVVCDACGQDHVEQVQYAQSPPGSELRAYISCPENGRVRVPLHRLRQWIIDAHRLPVTSAESHPEGDLQSSSGALDGIAVPTDEPLSDRARLVLEAMLELDAVDSDRRRTTEEIAVKAFGDNADPNALKSVMADLKTRELVQSKTGRGGGCWLTKKGRARAEKLRNG